MAIDTSPILVANVIIPVPGLTLYRRLLWPIHRVLVPDILVQYEEWYQASDDQIIEFKSDRSFTIKNVPGGLPLYTAYLNSAVITLDMVGQNKVELDMLKVREILENLPSDHQNGTHLTSLPV